MTITEKADRYDYVDHYHRIIQFRYWIDTNILFPTIPDIIRDPLLAQLYKMEEILTVKASMNGDLEKILAIQKLVMQKVK